MDFLRMDFLRRNGGPGAGGQQDDVERLAADEQLRNQERQGGLQLEGGGAMEQHPEMQERGPSLLRRFPLGPPTLPAIFSSRNSAMRRHRERASTTTAATEATGANGGDESPKTPRFTIGMPPLPSTRLDLPHLARTWTNGSNADSRPGTAVAGSGGRPSTSRTAGGHPAMSGARSRGGHGPATQQNDANSNDDNDIDITADPLPAEPSAAAQRFGTRRHRRRFRGGDPEDLGPAEVADEGRERRDRRRKRHRRRRHHHTRLGSSDGARTGRSGSGSGSGNRSGGRSRPEPKRFLFCFPWIRSRRVRSQILRCFVSGLFLTLLLTVYLALSITKNTINSEFTVLLILIILFTTIFFCHGLIRLCMLIVKPRGSTSSRGSESDEMRQRGGIMHDAAYVLPGGYAIPREPIRVVLARDEEAAGIESETTKMKPPAYGLWRESVRVDPNRIYWQRISDVPGADPGGPSRASTLVDGSGGAGASAAASSTAGDHRQRHRQPGDDDASSVYSSSRTSEPRPPSYVSDDGVGYVINAAPRSTVLFSSDAQPLPPHPAERGDNWRGQPAAW